MEKLTKEQKLAFMDAYLTEQEEKEKAKQEKREAQQKEKEERTQQKKGAKIARQQERAAKRQLVKWGLIGLGVIGGGVGLGLALDTNSGVRNLTEGFAGLFDGDAPEEENSDDVEVVNETPEAEDVDLEEV